LLDCIGTIEGLSLFCALFWARAFLFDRKLFLCKLKKKQLLPAAVVLVLEVK